MTGYTPSRSPGRRPCGGSDRLRSNGSTGRASCIMCVIHDRRVGPPSGLAAGAGRLHGPSSHREPRPGVRRPTLVTPLVPVTCVALALLIGGCSETASNPPRAAGVATTSITPPPRPARPTATTGDRVGAGAPAIRLAGATRPQLAPHPVLRPCLGQPDTAAGTPIVGVLVDLGRTHAPAVERRPRAAISAMAVVPLVRGRSAAAAAEPSPTIRPLPNYPRSPPPPPTVSVPGTTPRLQTPITACVENIRTNPRPPRTTVQRTVRSRRRG